MLEFPDGLYCVSEDVFIKRFFPDKNSNFAYLDTSRIYLGYCEYVFVSKKDFSIISDFKETRTFTTCFYDSSFRYLRCYKKLKPSL